MPMVESKLINIKGEPCGETDQCLCIRAGNATEWVRKEWVRKGIVENNGDGTFTMPDWLAKEKGFV